MGLLLVLFLHKLGRQELLVPGHQCWKIHDNVGDQPHTLHVCHAFWCHCTGVLRLVLVLQDNIHLLCPCLGPQDGLGILCCQCWGEHAAQGGNSLSKHRLLLPRHGRRHHPPASLGGRTHSQTDNW